MTSLTADRALAEEFKASEVARSSVLLTKLVTLVRRALTASDYLQERDAAWDDFLSYMLEYGNLSIDPSERAGAISDPRDAFGAIARRFGSGWLRGLDASQRFIDGSFELLDQVIAVRSLRVARNRDKDAAFRQAYDEALCRHNWALIAAQIAARDAIELSDVALSSIEDDLTYTAREAYLAVCGGAHLRGESRYCWLEMVYRCEAGGDSSAAMALLFDAVTAHQQEPPLYLIGFFNALDPTRLSARLLQAVLTITDLTPEPVGRSQFVATAQVMLSSRYARATRSTE